MANGLTRLQSRFLADPDHAAKIAAGPCEIFSETGLKIKAASPFEHTINMELANGYSGYLPDRQQHQWGGYETWPARSSHLEVDAEEEIRNALVRLLNDLHQREP